MKVIAEGDLRELLLTGENRRYKAIARNRDLLDGLNRAVSFMIAAENIDNLKSASFLHYEKLKYS